MKKSFIDLKNEVLKDPEMKKAYEDSRDAFELKCKLLELRIAKNLTQSELAERMNTTKTAI